MSGKPKGHPKAVDFSRAPFLVIWETTRSCALACKHCRAEAILGRHADELTTDEGRRIIGQTAEMGTPIFILSGGDPFNRPDLEDLIAHGKSLGLRMGTIPAATKNLTRERVKACREAGLDQMAFSLDGPSAALNDEFRGVPGAFDRTMAGIDFAHHAKLPVQINTCFTSWNYEHLDAMVALVRRLGIVFWEVFFLVPTGRGAELHNMAASRFEEVFDRLYRLNREEDFIIKVTEAQHYRRFVIQKESAAEGDPEKARERIRHILARPRGVAGSVGMSPEAVNSGKGFVFVDHLGGVYPSGFLPLTVGSVRESSLIDLYRDSKLFRELRDPALLKGKCGACEFRQVCGGSRARAYALTGDHLAEDPCCAYIPEGWSGRSGV